MSWLSRSVMARPHLLFSVALPLITTITLGACGGSAAPFVDPRPLGDGGIPDRIALEAGTDSGRDGSTHGDADDAADPDAPGDDGAADAASDGTSDGSGDASAGDVPSDAASEGASNGDATDDAPVLATTVLVDITAPAEGALQVASQRFAPTVSVRVVTDSTRTDDVKQVDAELWSTATPAVRISNTRLAQLNRTVQGGAGAGSSGSTGGSTGAVGGAAGAAAMTGTGGLAGTGGSSGGGAGGGGGNAGNNGGASGDPAPSFPSTETVFAFGDTPVDLSSIVTDTYELRVTATTLAGVMASATRRLRIDAGPVIKVIAPLVGQAARGSIFVNVQVIDPFSTTPPAVTIKVANLPVTPLTVMGDLYQATVAETLASPPLSGEQLLDVGAVNAAGVPARHVSVKFVFDDLGPVITSGKPATGTLIGGVVKLEADVVDPAGVDVNTVVAVVAHGDSSFEVRLDQDPNDHKHFSHLFDTRLFKTTVLYPTLSFRASDLPGNQSSIGYTVAVDNTPPVAELDPPADLRVRRYVNQSWRCSWQFDPLGTDAVSDGDSVLQLFDIRARVQDEGNRPA
ncbi:MAG: hypothetical protein ABIS92_01925, partial [Polyangia bacterium]